MKHKLIGFSQRAEKVLRKLLKQVNRTLDQRTLDLATSKRSLKKVIAERRSVKAGLKKSGGQTRALNAKSQRLRRHLRDLTRQILVAQAKERQKISHHLRNEAALALLGTNARLLTLKKASGGNIARLTKAIAKTQRLVEESVQSIKRFAHELDIHRAA